MEDVQIWAINGSAAEELKPANQTESEKWLEDILSANPGLLMEGLALIGRQTPTKGGPLDLLGVDPQGKLVVFELKRGMLRRDAVAQAIDYVSALDDMSPAKLSALVSKSSEATATDRICNFQRWHEQQDFGNAEFTESEEPWKPIRMILVGLGVDDQAERMVRYLSGNGLDISLMTLHLFQNGDQTVLTKEMEWNSSEIDGPINQDRWVLLNNLTGKLGVRHLFNEVNAMIKNNWPEVDLRPTKTGVGFRMTINRDSKQRLGLGRISPVQGGVHLIFYRYREAVNSCVDMFRKTRQNVPFQTFPRNREPFDDPDVIHWEFPLKPDDWETHKDKLNTLTQTVYEAWQNSGSSD